MNAGVDEQLVIAVIHKEAQRQVARDLPSYPLAIRIYPTAIETDTFNRLFSLWRRMLDGTWAGGPAGDKGSDVLFLQNLMKEMGMGSEVGEKETVAAAIRAEAERQVKEGWTQYAGYHPRETERDIAVRLRYLWNKLVAGEVALMEPGGATDWKFLATLWERFGPDVPSVGPAPAADLRRRDDLPEHLL